MTEVVRDLAQGPVLFARYAFPPNSHGYCGPDNHTVFFEQAVAGTDDRRLRSMAQEFDGAWPFLKLIAAATGLDDPLDPQVVEAYWLGSADLGQVSMPTEKVLAGCVPHHSYAVFCVYPWTPLLADERKAPQALMVLDRCRIRWGRVLSVAGDKVVVEAAPLTWDGHQLAIGEPVTETVVRSVDGVGMVADLVVGDWVSLHWEWVCDRVSEQQVGCLRDYTDLHLRIVNEANLHGGRAG